MVPAVFDFTALPPQVQALLDATPDGLLVVAPDGAVVLANARVERLFGYTREELIGAPAVRLVPVLFRDLLPAHRERSAADLQAGPLELSARRNDGSEFLAEISLSPLDSAQGVFVIAALRDITERKRSEESQRALVAETSALLSSALDTTAVCDGMARLAVLHLADTCEIALAGPGRDLERIAVARRAPFERSPSPAPSHASVAIQEAMARAMDRRRSERLVERPEGSLTAAPHHALVVPLIARDQAIGAMVLVSEAQAYEGGALALAEDLGHRTAIAVDNARLYREAREANAAKDRFLALLGHELRNPLSAAVNALQVIDRVRNWDARLVRHLAIIDRQVRQLSRVVDDLLDVSRITAGKVILRREMVDLREVARRSVEANSLDTGGRRPELMLSAASGPIWVEGDATRLEQILDNLLTNALKYTPARGNILVEVRRQGNEAVLRVQDDGAGIEPQLLPRIFDLFIQGDQSLDHMRGGLGLGLPVVRHLVELHGGRIEVHSAGLNKGSEFIVRLPLFWEASQVAPQPPPRPLAPPAATVPHHLLVIEDNPDARQSLQELLQMSGHQVDVAEDGQRGIEVALAQRPDTAFVDIGLPLVDGYEVARRLRKHFGKQGIRLIALTGYGQPEDRVRALAAGFDVHLVKPVDLETVTRALSAPP